MVKLGKYCALFGVIILSAFLIAAFGVEYTFGAEYTFAAEAPVGLRYEYIMTNPVAVEFSETGLFILDDIGQVIKEDQHGLNVVGEQSEATKLAVNDEGVYITDVSEGYDGALSLFANGEIFGAVKADGIYVDGEQFESVSPSYSLLCGDVFDGKIYTCEKSGKTVSLFSYDTADHTRALVHGNVKTDGDIVAMTVVSESEIYYATNYSLFAVGNSAGRDIGGITSLTNNGEALYYTTRSGKVQRLTSESHTIRTAAESVSVATRKNFAVFTDMGNNKITVLGNDVRSVTVERPLSATIDYDGNILVATENKILGYSRNLERINELDVSFDEPVLQIAVDPSDTVDNSVYALLANGNLVCVSDGNTVAEGVARFRISMSGNIYVLDGDGNIKHDEDVVVNASDIDGDVVDFTLDVAENVFSATQNAIYKNKEKTSAEVTDLGKIDVSYTEMSGDNAVGYGDVIVIPDSGCGSYVINGKDVGTDMKDGEDVELTAFLEEANSAAPNAVDTEPDIRYAVVITDIYERPIESPTALGETGYGSYVIVIEEYPNSDYFYAIIEAPNGSTNGVKGFVNKNALSDPLPVEKLYKEEFCYSINKGSVYKYPSVVAPAVSDFSVGTTFTLLDFVGSYRDGVGRAWCRVQFTDQNGAHEGYILKNSASNAPAGGDNKAIVPDGYIKAGDNVEVKTYELNADGEYIENGTIANGTKIQLAEKYKRNNEYTKITYYEDEESGSTRTCYVKTEYINLTIGSWYQVIMFVVAGIVVIAVIIIIVVAVKKKKKIQ